MNLDFSGDHSLFVVDDTVLSRWELPRSLEMVLWRCVENVVTRARYRDPRHDCHLGVVGLAVSGAGERVRSPGSQMDCSTVPW